MPLGARTRKIVLVLHIVSVGAWIGIDVVMAVVVFTAVLSDDVDTKSLCYRILELITVWPLLIAGLVCLASGVVLGLGSRYGLVRYWWVATKLALNLALTTMVVIALRPLVADAGRVGAHLAAGQAAPAGVANLIYPPIVSPAALVFAVVLAVFKPWGRIRRQDDQVSGVTPRTRSGLR
jgi:hypothetical protein